MMNDIDIFDPRWQKAERHESERRQRIVAQRDSARRWSAAWKRAAKANKARHLHDVIKYKLKYRTAAKQRDEARAQLANAAAREVDAVQGRQECEAELREARRRNETLEAERRLLAEYIVNMGNVPQPQFEKVIALAQSIVEEGADD